MSPSNRLSGLRREKGWSQTRLAQALDVSRQTIHSIEAGKCHPSLPLALRIGRLFGSPVEEIFSMGGGPEEDEPYAPI